MNSVKVFVGLDYPSLIRVANQAEPRRNRRHGRSVVGRLGTCRLSAQSLVGTRRSPRTQASSAISTTDGQ